MITTIEDGREPVGRQMKDEIRSKLNSRISIIGDSAGLNALSVDGKRAGSERTAEADKLAEGENVEKADSSKNA